MIAQFSSNLTTGLSEDQATARLSEHGANQLKETNKVSATSILIVRWPTLLLWFCSPPWLFRLVSRIGFEGGVVTAVIVTNVSSASYRSTRRSAPWLRFARSLRPTPMSSVLLLSDHSPSKDLVPGDIVHSALVTYAPDDARLVTISNLEIDEAPLTGESVPAIKTTGALTRPHLPRRPYQPGLLRYHGHQRPRCRYRRCDWNEHANWTNCHCSCQQER